MALRRTRRRPCPAAATSEPRPTTTATRTARYSSRSCASRARSSCSGGPTSSGGWAWNVKGVRRVLYRLPELLARPDETVYVVEGEKDADRLASLGLLATTNSGGAGKWQDQYAETPPGP